MPTEVLISAFSISAGMLSGAAALLFFDCFLNFSFSQGLTNLNLVPGRTVVVLED